MAEGKITSDAVQEHVQRVLRDYWPADPEQVPLTREQFDAATGVAAKAVALAIMPTIAEYVDSASGRGVVLGEAMDALKRTGNFPGVAVVRKMLGKT